MRKGDLDTYIRDNSKRSLDGLLGLREARKMNGEWLLAGEITASINRQLVQVPAIMFGILVGILLFVLGPKILLYAANLSFKICTIVRKTW